MKIVNVDLAEKGYPIYIETGLLKKIGELFSKHQLTKTLAIITDNTVYDLYVEQVVANLHQAGFKTLVLKIPPGEESKSLKMVDYLCEKLINAQFDRKSIIVALGGGVVGDLAGFVAAIFLRGVDFIQIPTTLLAQTDSSVGGKVAVNHRLGKNLIGAFYHPRFVVIDPNVLTTLDRREVWAGLGEVIKYGIIGDRELFELLKFNLNQIASLHDLQLLEKIIKKCCCTKASIVEKDERESGLRKVLNFGHTIGHALEALTNYKFFLHGEAIIWGMLAANWLSYNEKLISKNDFIEIENLLKRVPLKKKWPEMTTQDILNKIAVDKKNINSQFCFVLLNEIGKCFYQNNFDKDKIYSAIDYIKLI